MKKLLVVLAVLFATVGAYAGTGAPGDPASDQATVTVDVICPITVAADVNLFYRVVAGQSRDLDANNTITFSIDGCTWEDEVEEGQTPTNSTKIIYTWSITPNSIAEDGKVVLTGDITLDGDIFADDESISGTAVGATEDAIDFDGDDEIVITVNNINAASDANQSSNYVWTFEVKAEYASL